MPGDAGVARRTRPETAPPDPRTSCRPAEVKRGELRRFYVKQVETGDAGEFERMTDDELREYIAGQGKILAALERDVLPPKGPKGGPVKH